MKAIEDFTAKLEKVAGIFDGLQVIAGKVDGLAAAVSSSSENEIALMDKMAESLQESIAGAFSSLDFPQCHFKEQPAPKSGGQYDKAFLLGFVLGVILAAGTMLIIK